METLKEIAMRCGTDKISFGYIDHYERHFESIRESVKNVLELGICEGKSLKMWRDYFPNAMIYGIDIEPKSWLDLGSRVQCICASQDDVSSLQKIGPIDIVIDDASHINKLTLASFDILNKSTKRFYVMEDMFCSYDHDIDKHRYEWPGMDYNKRLSREDWFNRRIDIDNFLKKQIELIDFIDGRSYWKALHVYNMIYFFERRS